MSKPILIGITGGTGSGKSTIADALYSNFSKDCIAMIQQDMYYKDQSHLSMEERVKTNYDHPMAFDNDLLVEHLKALINGKSIEKPSYDFTVHNRSKETAIVESRDIILVEGILILEPAGGYRAGSHRNAERLCSGTYLWGKGYGAAGCGRSPTGEGTALWR